jgi:hypothetical protein
MEAVSKFKVQNPNLKRQKFPELKQKVYVLVLTKRPDYQGTGWKRMSG